MKTPASLLPCLVAALVSLTGVRPLPAAEVACPSDAFPSPTGIYRNEATANVVYGATIQIAAQTCHLPDRSAPPPKSTSPETYVVCSTTHFRVANGGSTPPVDVTVPVDITFRLSPNAMGLPGVFDLEVLAFTATGLPGGILLRESPSLLSSGQHTIRQAPSGNYYISSFFDIFTEISTDGGTSWEPGDSSMHFELLEPDLLASTENHLPPAGTALVAAPSAQSVSYPGPVRVRNLQMKPGNSSITSLPLRGTLYQCDESGRATGALSLDGGATFTAFSCDYTAKKKYQAKAKVSEAYVYDQELLALDLSGGNLPSGLRLRESPTKASLGRASSRLAPDGLYRIGGFFDIFTEVSQDNGATWSPNDGPPCLVVNRHAHPYDLSVFGFTPQEITCSNARPQPSPHLLPLMARFENGDVPTQEDLVEFPGGTILRGLRLSFPFSAIKAPALGSPPVTQNITIPIQGEFSSNGGYSYEPFHDFATANVRVNAVAVGAGASASLYEMEWLSLDVTIALDSGTSFSLRESPTKLSTGTSAMHAAPDGTVMISSFFDIFTELSFDSGTTWESGGPLNMCLTSHLRAAKATGSPIAPLKWMAPESLREYPTPTSDFPPAGALLACPSDIHAPNGVVLRRAKVHGIHNGSNLPPPYGSKSFSFTTTASGELSTDGGLTFREWVGSCSADISLINFLEYDSEDDGSTDVRYFIGEILSLDLSGGGLGTTRLRESPTKMSRGRVSVRTTPDGTFAQLAVFDVFTELSTDNGTTWTPASGLPVDMAFTAPPVEHFFASVSAPMRGNYVSTETIPVTSSVSLFRLRHTSRRFSSRLGRMNSMTTSFLPVAPSKVKSPSMVV